VAESSPGHLCLDRVAGSTGYDQIFQVETVLVGQAASCHAVIDLESKRPRRFFSCILLVNTPCCALAVQARIPSTIQHECPQ
jgi:hypothetical protein